jgi:hypothetical protein
VALVALVGVSCKKQEEQRTFTATLGSGEWIDDYADGGEKLYLTDQRKLWFEAGDQVVLASVDYDDPSRSGWNRFEATEAGVTTHFTLCEGETLDPNLTGKRDAFFAYYPGDAGMVTFNWDSTGYGTTPEIYNHETYPNYGRFTLDTVQQYRSIAGVTAIPARALYAAAKDETATTWSNTNFNFAMIGGLLDLSFYNPLEAGGFDTMYVQRIVVTDTMLHLTGDVYMRIDRVDPGRLEQLILYYNHDDVNYMRQLQQYIDYVGYRVPGIHEGNLGLRHSLTLDCTAENPEGVLLNTTKAEANHFVFGVRPAAFCKGLIIDVYFKDKEGNEHHYQNGTSVNNMIKPSHRLIFSPLKIKKAYLVND